MHTTKIDKFRFHHNSDMSGDMIINSTEGQEIKQEIEIPFSVLKSFVTEHINIEDLEDLKAEDIERRLVTLGNVKTRLENKLRLLIFNKFKPVANSLAPNAEKVFDDFALHFGKRIDPSVIDAARLLCRLVAEKTGLFTPELHTEVHGSIKVVLCSELEWSIRPSMVSWPAVDVRAYHYPGGTFEQKVSNFRLASSVVEHAQKVLKSKTDTEL